jgi:hypothetical protein
MSTARNSAQCAVGPRHSFRFKRVLRLDHKGRIFRVARLVWQRGMVGDGIGYSSKLSLALRPRLFERRREYDGWLCTVAGIRVHHLRSWGGIQV